MQLLAGGGSISVQVLNEVLVNCRRKANMSWEECGIFLDGVREICDIVSLTPEIHDIGRAVAARYQLSDYDAMIVAAALSHGCQTLLSEDMHDGLLIEHLLLIENPFRSIAGTR